MDVIQWRLWRNKIVHSVYVKQHHSASYWKNLHVSWASCSYKFPWHKYYKLTLTENPTVLARSEVSFRRMIAQCCMWPVAINESWRRLCNWFIVNLRKYSAIILQLLVKSTLWRWKWIKKWKVQWKPWKNGPLRWIIEIQLSWWRVCSLTSQSYKARNTNREWGKGRRR